MVVPLVACSASTILSPCKPLLARDSQLWGKLSLQGVWDQGIFTDALESAGLGRHIYPYTYLQARLLYQ